MYTAYIIGQANTDEIQVVIAAKQLAKTKREESSSFY